MINATDVIRAIEALAPEERRKVEAYFRGQSAAASSIKYMDAESAKVAAERVFEEHHELFRKLAD